MHYVVIGAGPAGVIACEILRNLDADGQISLFTGEPEPPYSRMAIPYLMVGMIDEAGTYLRKSNAHYQQLAIEVRHDTITRVSPGARQISLASGGTLAYDKLLLATGSRAILPPVPGIDLPDIHTCWTLEDARHIVQRATPGARVLLIGAGFIGCIVLEALATRGVELTVVEMGDRMLPRMMNDTVAAMIKTWCEQQGVAVHTGTQVTAIEANAAAPRLRVQLSNGQSVDCHLVISAAGVTPNLDLLNGSGIATDRGVLVNTYLQSSDPHVYAAGDCAQSKDFSSAATAVHAIQPVAVEQGRIAAQNMAGRSTPYKGSFSMNVLDTLGLIAASFGLWMGAEGGEQVELSDPDHFRYLNLQFRDDRLVGATSLGMTQHVGILRGLIQSETHLGIWKERLLADPTRVVEAYLAMGLAYR
jgi:NAD(P)H-nitrite reductase large subunit